MAPPSQRHHAWYHAAVDEEDFEERPIRQSDELTLSLDGWEGPLDLLLNLARAQKVDLAQISILQLVEQYLTYLNEARALKLEIAADYLVMAAWQVRDFDLFAAYGAVRARTQPAMHVVHARAVMTLEEAIERVSKMIGMALDWTFLESFLPPSQDPQFRRSALASSFVAALELARRGRLDIAQDEPFAPIKLKAA